jgi:hypothetical protein
VAPERPLAMRENEIHRQSDDAGVYATAVCWLDLALTVAAVVTALAVMAVGRHDEAATAVFALAFRHLVELGRET